MIEDTQLDLWLNADNPSITTSCTVLRAGSSLKEYSIIPHKHAGEISSSLSISFNALSDNMSIVAGKFGVSRARSSDQHSSEQPQLATNGTAEGLSRSRTCIFTRENVQNLERLDSVSV